MSESAQKFKIRFWGTRGSVPSPGPRTLKYGGNTTCVEIRCGDELIIIDAGTGIRNLGTELLKESPVKASVLFSHVHWDHIQGIPFFRPAYKPGNGFKLYGNRNWDKKLEYVLRWQMKRPNFPITLEEVNAVGAKMEYINISSGDIFNLGRNGHPINVRSVELRHPDKAYGFRIEYGSKSIVFATDTESLPEPDPKLIELAYNTDLLIHDAQYTHDEYHGSDGSPKIHWGHSTPESAAETAIAVNAKKLVLFHHDPYHSDEVIDGILEAASTIFPNSIAACEGLVVEV